MTPIQWQAWGLMVMCLFSAMVLDADVRESRIPNVQVLLAMLSGVTLNTLGPSNGAEGLLSDFPGALGWLQSLAGLVLGVLLLLPLYALGVMGAGDVKWMGALGAFVGPYEVPGLLLSVLVAGGVLGVLRMLFKKQSRAVLQSTAAVLKQSWAQGRLQAPARTVDRMPYALAFAGGLALFVYARSHGVNLLRI